MTWLEEQFRTSMDTLQKRLSYQFRDRELLEQALTHRSYSNEDNVGVADNERLEFLGDAVLELQISRRLFHRFPEMSEGELTRARAAIVRSESLSDLAESLDLGTILRLGRGEEGTGGRTKTSVLADVFEALIGAIYIDGEWEAVDIVVQKLMGEKLSLPAEELTRRDPKGELQEVAHSMGMDSPRYELLEESGPPHQRRFRVGVILEENLAGEGQGASKKEAASIAATCALNRLQSGEFPPNGTAD